MEKNPFLIYTKSKEPSKVKKAYAWYTSTGLQEVDGLKPSSYLIELAQKNIDGTLTLDESKVFLEEYYKIKDDRKIYERQEEADKVSLRITEILLEDGFNFSYIEFLHIHKRLFEDIYEHAGKIRTYNISKKEWVLDGKSVIYSNFHNLKETLNYDLEEERKYKKNNLNSEELIKHFALFLSKIWQVHIFGEGNTRTVAVFFIKYFKSIGFDINNDIFSKNSWYFRNALVRANYNDFKNNIFETTYYLELFLKNLLLNENNKLDNKDLYIGKFYTKDNNKIQL